MALACMLGCSHPPADRATAPVVDPAPAPQSAAPAPPAPSEGVTPAPAAVPSEAVAPSPSGDKLAVSETEYQGWRYFHVYCERCHGTDALGTVDAPDLRYSISAEGGVTADSFRVIVWKGTKNEKENKVMKGFEDLLDDQRIEQLYAYVKARSEGRLAAGRPHRASGQQ
jgi:mono/diheme cytochrome c family protein